ncbi:MAG: AbgT family transporter [Bacilli bacterium]|nr:AbgT family transporter [Bacilli bacterium]
MDEKVKKRGLHPVWFFILLSGITIVLSVVLSLLKLQGNMYTVSQNGKVVSTIMTVKSLLSADGIRFIFGEGINNLLKYIPFGTIIVGLLGMGMVIKTGLLKEVFRRLSKKIPRRVMFFLFSLLCIVLGFSQDLAFVIMIPVSIALFTEYKRSQVVGMTMAFVSVAAGANINLFITSLDYSLIEIAKNSVKIVDKDYTYGYSGNIFIIVIASLLLAFLISVITEIISKKMPVRITEEEETIDEKTKSKALKKAGLCLLILGGLLAYSLIPNLPLSGLLLDNTQPLYVNKLFGANSPFVNGILFIVSFISLVTGLVYGISIKEIKGEKDIVKILSGSLNNIGELLLIIFFAAQFVALFKYTNIGEVLTSIMFDAIKNGNFSFILLILFSFIALVLSGVLLTSVATKWSMFSSSVMSSFMKSNITPEYAGGLFRLSSSVSNTVTPLFPYFSIYVGFMTLYSRHDFSIKKCYSLLIIYFIAITILWLFIIFGFYILGTPIGVQTYPTI